MTPREANAVLALAGQFDGRKPDADAAISWADILRGLRVEDCLAAVKAHYAESSQWLMPADLRRRVNAIRRDRIDRGRGYLSPPRWLDDIEDDAQHAIAYQRWLKSAEIALANGEEPETATPVERGPIPAEIRANFPAIANAIEQVQENTRD